MLGYFELFHSNQASDLTRHFTHFEFEKDSSYFAATADINYWFVLRQIMLAHFVSEMDSSNGHLKYSNFTKSYFGSKAA